MNACNTSAGLSLENLKSAIQAMQQITGPDGQRMNIGASYEVLPAPRKKDEQLFSRTSGRMFVAVESEGGGLEWQDTGGLFVVARDDDGALVWREGVSDEH